MKRLYAILSVAGFILPYAYFAPFIANNGLDFGLFFNQLFANNIASGFTVDILVASLVFWVFIYAETRKTPIRLWWLCVLGNLLVGLSFGLPLFLYFREAARERM